MESHVWWATLRIGGESGDQEPKETGLEHLHLLETATGVVADGLILGTEQATPFRLSYQIRTDSAWHIRECQLQLVGGKDQPLHLYTDGQGRWTDADGRACSSLEGCLYVDISTTPFTNTLPIRCLA